MLVRTLDRDGLPPRVHGLTTLDSAILVVSEHVDNGRDLEFAFDEMVRGIAHADVAGQLKHVAGFDVHEAFAVTGREIA